MVSSLRSYPHMMHMMQALIPIAYSKKSHRISWWQAAADKETVKDYISKNLDLL